MFLADRGAHSEWFGTFVGNCEMERAERLTFTDTVSLWDFVASNKDEFLNPL